MNHQMAVLSTQLNRSQHPRHLYEALDTNELSCLTVLVSVI